MVESAPFARWLPGGASHGRRLPSPGLVGRLELGCEPLPRGAAAHRPWPRQMLAAALGSILLAVVMILYWAYDRIVGIDNVKLG